MNSIFATTFLLISVGLNFSAYAETTRCEVKPSVLNCGEVRVKDNGCSKACEGNSVEPICDQGECHSLGTDHRYDYMCKNEGVTCVVGKDSTLYVINHSSCFCD